MENLLAHFGEVSLFSYAAAYISGAALSFTPCVYPLVPIVIAVIGSTDESSRRRNFYLALLYVAGMAITFSVLGVIAAATGALFGELRVNPVANLVIGNVILLFALSELGIIDIPAFSLSRAGAGKMISGKGVIPVFAMGLISGFIGAACVGPVLGTILLYIASTGNLVFGSSLLFVFAFGLGTLLIIAGVFTGILKNLGKHKKGMKAARVILAAAMILLAQYFIFMAGRYAPPGWF